MIFLKIQTNPRETVFSLKYSEIVCGLILVHHCNIIHIYRLLCHSCFHNHKKRISTYESVSPQLCHGPSPRGRIFLMADTHTVSVANRKTHHEIKINAFF